LSLTTPSSRIVNLPDARLGFEEGQHRAIHLLPLGLIRPNAKAGAFFTVGAH
jgi:hypothetical protein